MLNVDGIFKSSSECSTHLFLCTCISAVDLSSFFLTGWLVEFQYFSASILAVSHGRFIFPSLAYFSVVVASSSTSSSLSTPVLLFTYSFASVYSDYELTSSVLVQLMPITVVLFFLSWIQNRVSIEIHSLWSCSLRPTTSWHVEISPSLILFQFSPL